MSALVQLRTAPTGEFPQVPLVALDTLWFQVAGTICNLRCTHCFIACAPENHNHGMLSLETVAGHLDAALALGVRDYYFTGGEPFMNRDMLRILERTLRQGPATVLTNGTLISEATAQRLRQLSDASEYSLDLRVSIDGYDAATNDPIRGAGSFARIVEGIGRLAAVGLNPVITVSEVLDAAGSQKGRATFFEFLRSLGLSQPRLKILPLLRLGAETSRCRSYFDFESLAGVRLTSDDLDRLQCSRARMVTSQGVFVCPILIESKSARMGGALAETLRPFTLDHQACHTCYAEGLTCST